MKAAADAIQIRRPELARDIRALAALTGMSITDAIALAVRTQLAEERAKADSKASERRVRAERELAQIRALPRVGQAVSDADLYGADGRPR